MTQQFDLILKGGRVIDPAAGLDGLFDLAVKDGRIAQVAASIVPRRGERHRRPRPARAAGPDRHACALLPVRQRPLRPQRGHGRRSFRHHRHRRPGRRLGDDVSGVPQVHRRAGGQPRLLFISAYVVGGLEGHYYPSLYTPEGVDVAATIKVAEANRDLVKGIKAHAEWGGFARWGIEVMRLAKEIGRGAKLPVYIHFGQLWPLPEGGGAHVDPDTILPSIVDLLDEGDILAHPFSRHPGGFVDRNGKVHPVVYEAVKRGLKIDVGHGSHFSFNVARRVLDAGIMPDTLGADMHGYNTRVPPPPGTPSSHPDEENHPFAGSARFSLTHAMTGLMALGMPLETLVPMVTVNAARMLGLEGEIGTLKPGAVADVSVLSDERGRWRLRDNERTEVIAERLLQPLFCLRAGVQYQSDAPILPLAQAA